MKEDRLAEFLERYHSGESNAATSRELECVFSIRGIEVRQMVNRLRRKSIPIASSGNGYYYIDGHHEPVHPISANLQKHFIDNGMPQQELDRLLAGFHQKQGGEPV